MTTERNETIARLNKMLEILDTTPIANRDASYYEAHESIKNEMMELGYFCE